MTHLCSPLVQLSPDSDDGVLSALIFLFLEVLFHVRKITDEAYVQHCCDVVYATPGDKMAKVVHQYLLDL